MQNAVAQHLEAQQAGSITIRNEGFYVARFSITYTVAGQRFSQQTDPLGSLQSRSLFIPAGATDIHLLAEISYGLFWGSIFTQIFPSPVEKCYKVWGTVFEQGWAEISCS